MRIIITVNSYYPLKDGVQSVTEYHAEKLVKYGHQVTVITPSYGNKKNEIHNGVEILRIDITTRHAIYYGDKNAYQKLILEKEKNVDAIINVCTQNPMTDWCFPILNKIKCKKILYMHGMYNPKWNSSTIQNMGDVGHKIWNNFRWGIYYQKSKHYFDSYDNIIQLHRFDRAYLFFQKKYHIKSLVIENAAEDIFFEKKRDIIEKKYAIMVANYLPSKNQEFVLRAFYQTNLSNNYGLIFIGSKANDYYKKLVNLNKKLKTLYGEKDIQILYDISREKTVDYIKKASIYLFGSKGEVFPISIVEAMASGIPYISTDVGCVKYLPGGVVIKNEEEMAYWIALLFENSNTRKMLGMSGYEYALKHMSVEAKVRQLENILEDHQ